MTAISEAEARINGFVPAELEGAVEQIKENPSQARAGFALAAKWVNGARIRCTIDHLELGDETLPRRHGFDVDEPEQILGTDAGPNPVEVLLGAVASCMSITCAINAAAMGIAIDELELSMTGDVDLIAAFGLSEGVLPVLSGARCDLRIVSGASEAQIAELIESVKVTSPVYSSLTSPVPLELNVLRG